MSDKMMLIEIGYYSFVCPMDIGKNALEAFLAMRPVSKEHLEGEKTIYQPDNEREVSVKYIPAEDVRLATPNEKEKKEIADLKQRLEWKENDLKAEREKKKALECEVALLKMDTVKEASNERINHEGA